MIDVKSIFEEGPEAAAAFISGESEVRTADDLGIKELADISWTRARTLAKSQVQEAKRWAKVALAGYEFLSAHAESLIAESAGENAAALRSWRLLQNEATAA